MARFGFINTVMAACAGVFASRTAVDQAVMDDARKEPYKPVDVVRPPKTQMPSFTISSRRGPSFYAKGNGGTLAKARGFAEGKRAKAKAKGVATHKARMA
jgi:hypothetical protein